MNNDLFQSSKQIYELANFLNCSFVIFVVKFFLRRRVGPQLLVETRSEFSN